MQDGSATKRRRTAGEGGGPAGAAADAPTAAAAAAAVDARDSSDSDPDSDSDSDSESAADAGLIAPRWLRGSGAGSSSSSDGGESSDSAGPAAGWQDDVWAQLAQRRGESPLAEPREDLGHVLLLKPEELGELLADAPASEKAAAAPAEGVEGARLTWFSCGAPPPEEQEEEEEGEGRMVAADNAATLPPGAAAPDAELVSALDGQPVAANTTANTTTTVVTPAVAPAAVSLCSRAALCALLRA
eukprot:COSAG01_NODE_497_length_16267_cov_5.357558_23_plen_244_part_00